MRGADGFEELEGGVSGGSGAEAGEGRGEKQGFGGEEAGGEAEEHAGGVVGVIKI